MKVKNFRLWNRDPFYFFQWRVRLSFFDRWRENPTELNRFPSDRSPNASAADENGRVGKRAKARLRFFRFAASVNRPDSRPDVEEAKSATLARSSPTRVGAPATGRALVRLEKHLPVKTGLNHFLAVLPPPDFGGRP